VLAELSRLLYSHASSGFSALGGGAGETCKTNLYKIAMGRTVDIYPDEDFSNMLTSKIFQKCSEWGEEGSFYNSEPQPPILFFSTLD